MRKKQQKNTVTKTPMPERGTFFEPNIGLVSQNYLENKARFLGVGSYTEEGFAAMEKALGLNREIVNVNGSGVGLGHPVGSTGCRIMVTLLHALKKQEKGLGMATLCGGGGVSMAAVLEMI